MSTSVLLSATACPICHNRLDAATSMSGFKEYPESGDMTVCAECSGVLYFDEALQLKVAPREMLEALPAPVLKSLRAAVMAVLDGKAKRGPIN